MKLRLDLLEQLTADGLGIATTDSVRVVWRTDKTMAELTARPKV